MIEWTGERYLPWMKNAQMHYEHLHRYAFAAQFVEGKNVLDLACGEGYGSNILAEKAKSVVAIDVSKEAIHHAAGSYLRSNLQFINGSIVSIPIGEEKRFDVIVCFEAIEHLKEHEELLREVKRLLNEDGLFIASTPNKALYSDATGQQNPFHEKELYFDDFDRLLKTHFRYIRLLGQRVYAGSAIWDFLRNDRSFPETIKMAITERGFNFIKNDVRMPLYFYAIASGADLEPLLPRALESNLIDVSDALIRQYEDSGFELNNNLQNSRNRIAGLEQALKEKAEDIRRLTEALDNQISAFDSLRQQFDNSLALRILQKYRMIIDKNMRSGTRRRKAYEKVLSILKVIFFQRQLVFGKKSHQKAYRSEEIRPVLPSKIKNLLVTVSVREVKKLAFPAPGTAPEVSIIIAVCNKLDYTLRCLKSISVNTRGAYEVIVIDDASGDRTYNVLSKIENLQVIRNNENRGFLESANRGAKESKGKYLMFLNNDTVVAENWLSSLLETIKKENVGAVGSKLLNPDGTLQEAGSMVWNDGSALGYGRGDHPEKPEYEFAREVDYCSGASLLVTRDLFEKAGGFDVRYAPAYYEDTDLCLAVRNLGYKVMYQPKSVVIHFEGVTCGTDIVSDLKRHQEINKPRFAEKWSAVLQEKHFPPALSNVISARTKHVGKKILVIDDRIPVPSQGAGFPRAYRMLKQIGGLGYQVTFFPMADTTAWQPHTDELQQIGIEVFYGNNLDFTRFAQTRENYYDLVLVSRPHNMKKAFANIKQHWPGAVLIYDAEAMFSLREILKAKVKGTPYTDAEAQRMIHKEIDLVRQADTIITVSENEKKIIVERTQNNNVTVWGHPIDVRQPRTPFSARKDILFVGGFLAGESPNEDAIFYFTREIFPKLRNKLCCCLHIVGINPPDTVKNLSSSSVKVTGYVDDLEGYYEKCRIFVVPHRYSAGIAWKLQEAMSYGVPCVVSELTANQLNLTDGKEVLVADSTAQFIDKVAQLYQDEELWMRLQQNALKYISEDCNVKQLNMRLEQILRAPKLATHPIDRIQEKMKPVRNYFEQEVFQYRRGVITDNDQGSSEKDINKVSMLWSDKARENQEGKTRFLSWDAHPRTQAYINRMISGDANENWLSFIKRQFCATPLEHGLSLGSGWGLLEREALLLNICNQFDAYDISFGAIDIAKEEAFRHGLADRINYHQADLNTLKLTDDCQYDICFAVSSLHHINNLEHVISQVAGSLSPGGLFVVHDYTGPSRFQWSDKIESLINRILAIIPDAQKVNRLDGKTIKGTVRRPSVEDVIAVDPSEAIRSNEIVDILKGRFEVLYEKNIGGTLLQFMLADIIGNFRPDDINHNTMLELSILLEEILLEEKIIESWFSLLVLRCPSKL